jgi:hypothetical protein
VENHSENGQMEDHKEDGNINMGIREIEWDGRWTELAQNRVQLRFLVFVVLQLDGGGGGEIECIDLQNFGEKPSSKTVIWNMKK